MGAGMPDGADTGVGTDAAGDREAGSGARALTAPEAGLDAAADVDVDARLLQAHVAGDDRAFAALYDRHATACWRFIRHRLGPAETDAADDLLQDTWIAVARAAAGWRPDARFATWLFTIARNKVIDHQRSRMAAGGPTVSLDAPRGGPQAADGGADGGEGGTWGDWAQALPADPADEPLQRLQSREQAQAFVAAVQALPPEQREAFLLQADGGLSVLEIAAVTGVGAETAKTRLRYARDRLRQRLADWRTP